MGSRGLIDPTDITLYFALKMLRSLTFLELTLEKRKAL